MRSPSLITVSKGEGYTMPFISYTYIDTACHARTVMATPTSPIRAR